MRPVRSPSGHPRARRRSGPSASSPLAAALLLLACGCGDGAARPGGPHEGDGTIPTGRDDSVLALLPADVSSLHYRDLTRLRADPDFGEEVRAWARVAAADGLGGTEVIVRASIGGGKQSMTLQRGRYPEDRVRSVLAGVGTGLPAKVEQSGAWWLASHPIGASAWTGRWLVALQTDVGSDKVPLRSGGSLRAMLDGIRARTVPTLDRSDLAQGLVATVPADANHYALELGPIDLGLGDEVPRAVGEVVWAVYGREWACGFRYRFATEADARAAHARLSWKDPDVSFRDRIQPGMRGVLEGRDVVFSVRVSEAEGRRAIVRRPATPDVSGFPPVAR